MSRREAVREAEHTVRQGGERGRAARYKTRSHRSVLQLNGGLAVLTGGSVDRIGEIVVVASDRERISHAGALGCRGLGRSYRAASPAQQRARAIWPAAVLWIDSWVWNRACIALETPGRLHENALILPAKGRECSRAPRDKSRTRD